MSHPNFFMGQRGNARYRTPRNAEIQFSHHNFENAPRAMEPAFRHPRFNYSQNCQNMRPRQPFNGRIQPYHIGHSQDRQGNPAYSRGQFPNSPPPMPMQMARNNAPFHGRFNERRQQDCGYRQENAENFHPQYVLRTTIGELRRDYHHHTHRGGSRHFTEVCASVNVTIKTSYEITRENTKVEGRNPLRHCEGFNRTSFDSCEKDESGFEATEVDDDVAVAVESMPDSSPISGSEDDVLPSSNKVSYSEGEDVNAEETDSEGSTIQTSQEEEYEPENPDINSRALPRKDKNVESDPYGNTEEDSFISQNHQQQMASCDDDGFYEIYVGVCISRYPSVLGRMLEVAGYGVWLSDGNKRNSSGVLKPDRPQNTKAVMIHGSARSVEIMKELGYSRIRVNLETEYLNENVLGWISKYMTNPKAPPSNWDEVKYHAEIIELCDSANGMVIKWSHCCDASLKKTGIEKAKLLAKRATDAWIKELRYLQEAVGTTATNTN